MVGGPSSQLSESSTAAGRDLNTVNVLTQDSWGWFHSKATILPATNPFPFDSNSACHNAGGASVSLCGLGAVNCQKIYKYAAVICKNAKLQILCHRKVIKDHLNAGELWILKLKKLNDGWTNIYFEKSTHYSTNHSANCQHSE